MTQPTTPLPTPLPTRTGYAAPPAPSELAARLGIPLSAICKLDASESPFGPTPKALAAIAALAAPPTELLGVGRYPDPLAGELRAALATYTGVAAEQIVVGNGADEVIVLLCRVLLRPGDEVVVSGPTFSVYAMAAQHCGARVVDVGRTADFAVDEDALLAAIGPATRLIFLCSPNNPTGTLLPRATVLAALERSRAVAAEAAGEGPLVVVDEAYYEFGALTDDPTAWTAAPLLAEGERLVVLRTFSKIFGLAGLRVGYGLCPPVLATLLRTHKEPYNVNGVALAAARAALDDGAWVQARAGELVAERERLAAALATLPGVRVYPSSANFLVAELGANVEASARRDALWEALLARGIMVRRQTGHRLAGALRLSIGTPAQNDRLIAALDELLRAPASLTPAQEARA